MPTGTPKSPEQIAAYFWAMRERELASLVMSVTQSVEEAKHCQAVIAGMWDTAKSHESDWQDAIVKAQQVIRNARAKRTRLRKMVHGLEDTLRIRKHLADHLPERVRAEIEVAKRMVQYMDAHGF